ncbi:MAG: MBL fold metallo-hydrolase [Geobacteraceae bacterium]|nr:MBL fold metallo-hydrolase [Geobacteraceae bacterium]
MRSRFPFRYLEPTFFSGLLDDPVLYLHVRPTGRACLLDCGQIHHLAKRVLRSVDALFVSHAHMDHFMGFDTFIRNNHVSPRTFDIYGPPGIAGKCAGKLAGYDWNLTEPNWCTLRVHEVFPDRIATFVLPGAEGFPCRCSGEEPRRDRTIHRSADVTVAADLCDHKIPSLIFRVSERPSFRVDEGKLARAGLVRGEWLRTMQKSFNGGLFGREPLKVLRRREETVAEEEVTELRGLYQLIRSDQPPAAIGYVTDIGAGSENLAKVVSLMEGVTLLVCECSFLAAEREKARTSRHLCTDDLNRLMERLRPPFVLPMHLSKSYLGESRRLYQELAPPPGVTILRLPEHLAPRPLLASEVPDLL